MLDAGKYSGDLDLPTSRWHSGLLDTGNWKVSTGSGIIKLLYVSLIFWLTVFVVGVGSEAGR